MRTRSDGEGAGERVPPCGWPPVGKGSTDRPPLMLHGVPELAAEGDARTERVEVLDGCTVKVRCEAVADTVELWLAERAAEAVVHAVGLLLGECVTAVSMSSWP
jgi:hypothetical protein